MTRPGIPPKFFVERSVTLAGLLAAQLLVTVLVGAAIIGNSAVKAAVLGNGAILLAAFAMSLGPLLYMCE